MSAIELIPRSYEVSVQTPGRPGPPGPPGPEGPAGPPGTDLTYVHVQGTPEVVWNVTHGLAKWPSVSVVDTANNQLIADVTYIDEDSLDVLFGAPTSGRAYIN